MGWWHGVRRGWLSVSARVRFHKSSSSSSSGGGGGGGNAGAGGGGGADGNGLLQLRDEVKMCSYKDVHVMWNMLTGIDTNIPAPPNPTTTKKRSSWNWRVLFWSNHKLAPSFSSSSSFP